ncbi:MAG: DUF4105 domain-containing protein [Treponema sp.]|nr:DUF4105 domain-containing protein [Treponema sp.]
MNKFLAGIVLIFIIAFPIPARESEVDFGETTTGDSLSNLAARGKYLTVKMAVCGPGDEIYIWWGHIGIIIEDTLTGKNRFFDWGVFSFDAEDFYYDFAFGRMLYCCMATPAEYTLSRVINENLDVTLYTLDLSPEAKAELLLFAETIVLPENRDYLYHMFNDNCATRVRDIIDMAVGGAFKAQYGEAPGRFTLRQHMRRHTWFSPFWDWFISFLMGQEGDLPITVWDEMFLPSENGLCIKDFRYIDDDGTERKLVSNIEVINRSEGRPGTLEIPQKYWIKELLVGLSLAVMFGVLRLRAAGIIPGTKRTGKLWFFKTTEGTRYVLGFTQAIAGLAFGVMGSLLFFMSFFTTHDYTYHNANLLFINPLLFAAVPFGFIFAFGRNQQKRQKAERILCGLWTIIFLGGILSIVIRFFPAFYQQNQPAQALVIPFAFVLSLVPGWLKKGKIRITGDL